MQSRVWAVVPWIGLCLMVGILAGCGGSSSSSTGPSLSGGGGGSGAVVQGQIRTRTASAGEPAVMVVLEKLLGIGIAEAATAPVPDGTVVRLVAIAGGVTLETTTTGGAFTFPNVLPGQYTLEVVGFPVVTGDTSFFVGAGDLARIDGVAVQDDVTLAVAITAPQTTADNVLQSDAQVGHLINLAQAAGVPADQVLALRLQGMGWGQIAHTLGVSPSRIGLGHPPSQADIDTVRASHGKGKKKGTA